MAASRRRAAPQRTIRAEQGASALHPREVAPTLPGQRRYSSPRKPGRGALPCRWQSIPQIRPPKPLPGYTRLVKCEPIYYVGRRSEARIEKSILYLDNTPASASSSIGRHSSSTARRYCSSACRFGSEQASPRVAAISVVEMAPRSASSKSCRIVLCVPASYTALVKTRLRGSPCSCGLSLSIGWASGASSAMNTERRWPGRWGVWPSRCFPGGKTGTGGRRISPCSVASAGRSRQHVVHEGGGVHALAR